MELAIAADAGSLPAPHSRPTARAGAPSEAAGLSQLLQRAAGQGARVLCWQVREEAGGCVLLLYQPQPLLPRQPRADVPERSLQNGEREPGPTAFCCQEEPEGNAFEIKVEVDHSSHCFHL